MEIIIAAVALIVLLFLFSAIRVVREYERGVIFRLGRLVGAKGPGIFLRVSNSRVAFAGPCLKRLPSPFRVRLYRYPLKVVG